MRVFKNSLGLFGMLLLMTSFSQCSSAQKLQQKAPITIEQVYCQSWIAGVEGGGSGINIFIPTADTSVTLDSVYFRGQATKLELDETGKRMYIGRFKTAFNQPKEIIMSGNAEEEFGNELPQIPQKIPFDLNNNECVISYIDGTKTKYFKVDNVVEKESIPYPSAPPNKQ